MIEMQVAASCDPNSTSAGFMGFENVSATETVAIPPVSMLRFEAHAPPSWTDYTALVDACSGAAQPLMTRFAEADYTIWLFLVGATLTRPKRSAIPHYALAGPARKANIIGPRYVERTFEAADTLRDAGLYEIELAAFQPACRFLNSKVYPFLILSRRPAFASPNTLSQMVAASAYDLDRKPIQALSWEAQVAALCPLGDVVVRTGGGFDDLDRSLSFLYMTASIGPKISAALAEAGTQSTPGWVG